MKKIIALIAFSLLLIGCGGKPVVVTPPPPTKIDWTVTAKWNYDFTNFFVCSASVSKGCVSSFTWGYMQGTAKVPLHANVSTSVCSGSTQPQQCTDTVNVQLPVGSITWYADANATDLNGAAVTASTTSAVPTQVDLDKVANLVVSKQ